MQQLEQHIKEINGKHYTITPFVGTKGFKYLGRLTKYATPLVGALAQQGEDVDLPAIIQNVFFEGTDEFVSLILELVSDVHRDGMKINPDVEFKKNYMTLLELALEVIKINYEDVFTKLGISFN